MTRTDALLALLTFPFVAACIGLFVGAIWLAFQHETKQPDLTSPWRDREPGDL